MRGRCAVSRDSDIDSDSDDACTIWSAAALVGPLPSAATLCATFALCDAGSATHRGLPVLAFVAGAISLSAARYVCVDPVRRGRRHDALVAENVAHVAGYLAAAPVNAAAVSMRAHDMPLASDGAWRFGAALQHHQLRQLRLSKCGLASAPQVAALLAALSVPRALLRLDLRNNNIGAGDAAAALGDALREMPCLLRLDLGHNPLTAAFAPLLAPLQSLRRLELSYTVVCRDDACAAIGGAVGSMSHLTHLRLRCTGMDDAGARHLARGLGVHPSLRLLDARSNALSEAGGVQLQDACRRIATVSVAADVDDPLTARIRM
jgi:hypothetical protein